MKKRQRKKNSRKSPLIFHNNNYHNGKLKWRTSTVKKCFWFWDEVGIIKWGEGRPIGGAFPRWAFMGSDSKVYDFSDDKRPRCIRVSSIPQT